MLCHKNHIQIEYSIFSIDKTTVKPDLIAQKELSSVQL